MQKHIFTYWKECLIFLSFFFYVSFIRAELSVSVRTIPLLNELPVKAIHRIFQDSEGYMWYGTFDGLCRYDGYNIKVFRSDLYHPGLLASNYITYIVEDHEGKIWFGTLKGAYILDKQTYKITPVSMPPNADLNIFTMSVTRDGNIWISILGKLLKYNPQGTLIATYPTFYNKSARYVYFVYNDHRGRVLMSMTGGGMYCFDKRTGQFRPYYRDNRYMDIERIIRDEAHQCYWLGTWGKGIVRFTPEQSSRGTVYVQQPLPRDVTGKPVGNLFHIVQDDALHYLWVTADKDLFVFKILSNGMLRQLNTSSFLPQENKMLYEIYKDRTNALWVSAFDMESFIIDIREQTVKYYPFIPLRTDIHANPAITAMCKDNTGWFWINQDRRGLYLFNDQTQQLTYFKTCPQVADLSLGNLVAVIPSALLRGTVWCAAYGSKVVGISHEGSRMQRIADVDLKTVSRNPGLISALKEVGRTVWIGTTMGLFAWLPQSGKLMKVTDRLGNVTGIIQTGDGKIYFVVQQKGLYTVENNRIRLLVPCNKKFSTLVTTSDGQLWMGTEEGEVLSYSIAERKLKDYSNICGMNGDIINAIVVDNYNHVWIETNQEIKEFNPRNGAFLTYHTGSVNLHLTRFFSRAAHFDRDGRVYFGGVGGVISFAASQQLESIPENVRTLVTDIKVDGKSLMERPETNVFEKGIVRLQPDEGELEISFSSLDYLHLDQVRYAYCLEGVDKGWMFTENGKNSVIYKNLRKGKYIFKVKATDKNGLLSDKVTTLIIQRLPAWYETWYAYTIYVLFAGGIMYLIIRLYKDEIRRQNNRKLIERMNLMERKMMLPENRRLDEYCGEDLFLPKGYTSQDERLIKKATTYIGEHLSDQHLGVNTLAEYLHVSRSTLTRKMKAITGQTPLDFIRSIKMQNACKMLQNPTTTISEIVNALGYSDRKYFTESFKEVYGMTPTEYHKTHISGNKTESSE